MKRLEELSHMEVRNHIHIDVDIIGGLTGIRNVILGIFLRKYQDLCECRVKRKEHYFTECPLTKEFRRILGRSGRN